MLAAAVASPAAWAAGHRGGTRDVPVAVTELERTELTGVNALPIDELITTARKTEESTLDVPLAVTTFTADQIDRAQIQSLTDVAAFTPGFSFQNFFGQQLATPVIRGVAQIDIF